MWRRLAKHSFSIGLGQGINLAQQLLLPVAFLRQFGVEGYGAWLVVMAAAGQLGNLDFGLQTYLNNRLTMLHAAGDFAQFCRLQSIGLRLALGLGGLGFLGLLIAQGLPLESWLRLGWSPTEARPVLLLLGTWVILRLIQGQLAAVLRASGAAHRAQQWDNLQRAGLLVASLLLLHWRCDIVWLAVAHVVSVVVGIALVLWDTRRSPVAPSLREWNTHEAREMVCPSLFFGLTTLNFLVLYEVPLLILQWTLGPVAVVTFATTRTLFSAARQLLTPVQLAVQQELTRSFGGPIPGQLWKLQRFSETVALAGGGFLVVALAVLSPWVIELWLHGRTDPSAAMLALMAAVGLATIFKDNQYALPLATNCHERATLLIGGGYLVMSVAGLWLAQIAGEPGLLLAWLITELVLAVVIFRWNRPPGEDPQSARLWAAAALPVVVVPGVYALLVWLEGASWVLRAGCATLAATVTGAIALLLFGDGLAAPARRFMGSLNFCRQEG